MTENQFSVREQDVIVLLMKGKSNKEIAMTLGIVNRSVESHLTNIYAKLSVTSRTEAVIKLSDFCLWKSIEEIGVANQGNPQLKKEDNGVILTKIYYHSSRLRRRSMKTLVRLLILVLAVIIIVTLIIGAFSLLRQNPNSLVTISISTALKGHTSIRIEDATQHRVLDRW